MKRFITTAAVFVLACSALRAQTEEKAFRFEVGAGSGWPTVLSGPDLQNQTNVVARLGFYPSKSFMLAVGYNKWNTDVAPNDILNQHFSEIYRESVASNVNFNDALLKNSTTDLEQWSLELW